MVTKRGLAGVVLSVACLQVAGCDEDGGPGESLRAAGEDVEFWNFRPNDPGNGPVEMAEDGDDNGLPDTIIWCIDGDGTGSDVFDPITYDLVVSTWENQIFDATGNIACTAHAEGDLFKLRQGIDGPVLLTATEGRYVFFGDVPALPEPGTYAWQYLIYDQLAYEFYGDLLYDGPRWAADVIAYADVHVHKASPMRKLLIAALYEGVCDAPYQPGQN